MDMVEFTPTPEQYGWTFGGASPLLEVRPGTAMRLWTEDAYCGLLTRSTDKASELLRGDLNPQTGPFFVTGAEPGDTLALHFVEVQPARDWGVSTLIPLFGGLTNTVLAPTLNEPLPELTWIYQADLSKRTVLFEALSGEIAIELPLEPMLGTVGLAPSMREARTSLVPGAFGGNMDSPDVKAGATVYLGVNVPGALFSVGDGHYRQGEGESCGCAVEGAMNVTLIVDLIKGGAPAWPRIEHDDALMTVGSGRPLDDAWRISQVEMIAWLNSAYGLDRLDAYQLLSQISECPIANVVDTSFSATTKVRKRFLPAGGDRFGGIHERLRSQGRQLL